MKRPACKEWVRADASKRSSASAMNQSDRDVTPVTANSISKQSTQRSRDPRLAARSRDPRLATSLHSPPVEQAMIQPTVSPSRRVTILKIAIDPRDGLPLLFSHSVELTSHDPATQPVPTMIRFPPGVPIHTFRVTKDPSDGHYVTLSHTVEVTGHSPNSLVDPSNSSEGQPSGSDVKARETHDGMMFKTALEEFVTKQIEKTRDIIVQKIVDNIIRSDKNIPSTEERIGYYLSLYKEKITKLIQEYFHKYGAKPPR